MTLAVTDLPDQLYADAEVSRLMCLLADGDVSRARAGAVAILAGRGRPDSACALAGALTALAHISWWEGRVDDALGLAHAAIRRADPGGVIGLRVLPRLLLAGMLTGLGDFDAAEAALAACSEEIELDGDSLWAAAPTIAWSALDLGRGRLGEAFGGPRPVCPSPRSWAFGSCPDGPGGCWPRLRWTGAISTKPPPTWNATRRHLHPLAPRLPSRISSCTPGS